MLLDPAVKKAMEVLQDPEVRAKLLEQSRSLVDAAQRWGEARHAKPSGGDYEEDPSPISRLIGNRFGQVCDPLLQVATPLILRTEREGS
jgi:hypothetical protein